MLSISSFLVNLGPEIFAGVNPEDEVKSFLDSEPLYDTLWMDHKDVIRQLDAIIKSDKNGFHRLHGISDNDSNP